jgi:hypothetical protein
LRYPGEDSVGKQVIDGSFRSASFKS